MSRIFGIGLAVALLLIAVLALAWSGTIDFPWSSQEEGRALVASGTVEATDASLGFAVPGTLASIDPREGDTVAVGAVVARLETGELEARRAEARSRLEAAAARLDELEAGFRDEEVAQGRARKTAVRQRLLDAERDLERTRTLFEGGAVPREAVDKAELARDLAAAEVEQASEQLRLLESGPRPQQLAAARAERDAAAAAVDALEARLADTELVAPTPGTVQVRHREPGEVVGGGAPVLTLTDLDRRWVRIYVPEDRLGAVRLGAEASIRSDTWPDRVFPGEVFFIASEAEFTPETVQTREERVRLVYAVKVRVVDDPDQALKPGMPVDVEIPWPEPPAGGVEDGREG